jgi:hypothetical protein
MDTFFTIVPPIHGVIHGQITGSKTAIKTDQNQNWRRVEMISWSDFAGKCNKLVPILCMIRFSNIISSYFRTYLLLFVQQEIEISLDKTSRCIQKLHPINPSHLTYTIWPSVKVGLCLGGFMAGWGVVFGPV